MFGKERVMALIKRHAGASAGTIRDCLVSALKDFCGSSDVEDDITMVVIKLDRTIASHQNTAGKAAKTFDSNQSRQA
jgi:hypothetical protein